MAVSYQREPAPALQDIHAPLREVPPPQAPPEQPDLSTPPSLERLLACPLALDRVTSDLGGRRVLDEVTVPVAHGQITVLIGPSGVGKTVCVKHLVGLHQPTYGRVLAEGFDLRSLDQAKERDLRRRMSVMLQGPTPFNCGIFGSLNAFENVAFPLREREHVSEDEIQERTWDMLTQLGLLKRARAMPEELSGGELRRVALGRALVSDSELVIIDDVESGVDHVRLRGMINLIAKRQLQSKSTFLITTNEPEVARKLADRLVVLRAGRVVEQGSATKILRARDAFGRRLMEGDPASGLAMLDEVDPAPKGGHRARSRSSDYDLRTGMMLMFMVVFSALAWWAYTENMFPGVR